MSDRQERTQEAMRSLAKTLRTIADQYEAEGKPEWAQEKREEADWYDFHAELPTGLSIPQEAQNHHD